MIKIIILFFLVSTIIFSQENNKFNINSKWNLNNKTLEVQISIPVPCVVNADIIDNENNIIENIFENRTLKKGENIFNVILPETIESGTYEVLIKAKAFSFIKIRSFGRFGSADGKFKSPKGIDIDVFGNIYIVDSENDRIQKFDSECNYKMQWGGFAWADDTEDENDEFSDNNSDGSGFFNSPYDIIASRYIFVTDTENNRIQKFDIYGNYLRSFCKEGSSDGELSLPKGIDDDNDNYIYVVDSENDRIQKFDIDGNFVLKFGYFGYGKGQFSNPTDISIDQKNNNIYVADTDNNRIQKFNEFGTYLDEFGKDDKIFLKKPRGVSVDDGQNIYISDTEKKRIVILDNNKNIILTKELKYKPNDIKIFKNSIILVSYVNENKIDIFKDILVNIKKKLNYEKN